MLTATGHLRGRGPSTGPSTRRCAIGHAADQVASLGNPGRFAIIAGMLGIICLIGRSRLSLIAAGTSLVGELLLVELVLKPVVGSRLGPHGAPSSYPSGHTATAVCTATLVILFLGRSDGPLRLNLPKALRAVLTLLAILAGPTIGISMIIVRAHSSIDVIGAIPLGTALTLLVCAGIDRIGCPRQPPVTKAEEERISPASTRGFLTGPT